jgi:hypothetical protein
VSKSSIVKGIVVLAALALVCGCAGMGKGPSDEELIKGQLETLKAGLLGKDFNKVVGTLSENFYHPEVGNKQAASDLIKQGIDSGFVDNGQIDLTKTKIKIEKDTATAYPIEASAPAGSATVQLNLKKEKAGWFIVGGDAEGV